jgi:hypothetical protein
VLFSPGLLLRTPRPKVPITTNITTLTNIYTYHSRNLLLSYGIALLFAFIACLLGSFAYWANGASCSRSFSAVLVSTRAAELSQLFRAELMGQLLLHENAERTRLAFERWRRDGEKSSGGGGWEFRISHEGRSDVWTRCGQRVNGIIRNKRKVGDREK